MAYRSTCSTVLSSSRLSLTRSRRSVASCRSGATISSWAFVASTCSRSHRCQEEDASLTAQALEVLTKIGAETSLRCVSRFFSIRLKVGSRSTATLSISSPSPSSSRDVEKRQAVPSTCPISVESTLSTAMSVVQYRCVGRHFATLPRGIYSALAQFCKEMEASWGGESQEWWKLAAPAVNGDSSAPPNGAIPTDGAVPMEVMA